LLAQTLAERVSLNELLELWDDRVESTEDEVGRDSPLDRRELELFEPADLLLGERVVGEIGERRPTPKRERIA
jgi:hypothetical protein